MAENYYDILGVEKTATDEEIKKAYRKGAHKHHPDKEGGDEATFKKINEAYQVLSDKQKRQQYDQFGQTFDQGQAGGAGFQGFGGQDFGGFDFSNAGGFADIFSDIFGGGQSRGRERGKDIAIDMTISFDEAINGAKKQTTLRKRNTCTHCRGNGAEPGTPISSCATCKGSGTVQRVQRSVLGMMQTQAVCPDCQGQGKRAETPCNECGGDGRVRSESTMDITVPKGIQDGQTVKLSGAGEAAPSGGTAGDLYVTVRVQSHRFFTRQGADIYLEYPITYTQAVFGDRVDVPTVDGEVSLKIPKGATSGQTIRLRGKGVTTHGSYAQGDQFVTLRIATATKLSRKEKKILQELADEEQALKKKLQQQFD